MKHKVAELEGVLLDAAVAKAEGEVVVAGHNDGIAVRMQNGYGGTLDCPPIHYSTQWDLGGPLIARERITIANEGPQDWWAATDVEVGNNWHITGQQLGPTPLIAAMRAYVASKFGDEVEL